MLVSPLPVNVGLGFDAVKMLTSLSKVAIYSREVSF